MVGDRHDGEIESRIYHLGGIDQLRKIEKAAPRSLRHKNWQARKLLRREARRRGQLA